MVENKRDRAEMADFCMKHRRPARRVCLACDKPFASEGPWNRICNKCKEKQKEARRLPESEDGGWVTEAYLKRLARLRRRRRESAAGSKRT